MFYAVPTARVIFTAKTSLDLGDGIYEMRYLFVVMGLNAVFIVLRHMDNMS